MPRLDRLARTAGIAALALTFATPALAGKGDRAQEAIALARGKVETAAKLGVAGDLPRMNAEAAATLRAAEEDAKAGHKDRAIREANHAAELADVAIGEAQKMQANAAQSRVADARADAAEANARADAAQQAAASAAADAAAARAAPPVAIVTPAPAPAPTTTVTVEKTATAAPVRTTAVRRAPVRRTTTTRTVARPVVTEKTVVTTRTN